MYTGYALADQLVLVWKLPEPPFEKYEHPLLLFDPKPLLVSNELLPPDELLDIKTIPLLLNGFALTNNNAYPLPLFQEILRRCYPTTPIK